MNKRLPARPNLEHLRTQAKTLLSNLKQGKAQPFLEHLPAAKGKTPDQLKGLRLADAQTVVARQCGFASWPNLVHHVEQLRSMEGTWEFESLEVDGSPMPFGDARLLIDGDRFRMESPEAHYEGIFTVDAECDPHWIDIEFVEGPEAGNWCHGIYELHGDVLRLCLGLVGAERPSAFETKPGSGHALEELRRSKRIRPEGVDGGTPRQAATATQSEPQELDAFVPCEYRGAWVPTHLAMNGKELAANLLSMGSRITTESETKVVFGGQTMLHAKVRIDERQAPAAVDYLYLFGPAKGKIGLGIAAWIDGELCFNIAAPGQPRPTDFTCEPESNRTFSRWRKA